MGSGAKFQANGDIFAGAHHALPENGKSAFVDFLADVGSDEGAVLVSAPAEKTTEFQNTSVYFAVTRQHPDISAGERDSEHVYGTSGRQRVQNDVLGVTCWCRMKMSDAAYARVIGPK